MRDIRANLYIPFAGEKTPKLSALPRLQDLPTIRLPDYPATKLLNYPTTELTGGKKDSQTIGPPQLQDYPTI